ncbi:DUF805 domain-containing protein [Gottfriedia acidiceleris]|uniref:DUF805 domain-containing protein n=1 Tax=Gottfriedia acidiceleris TaxID=371036 RepID=A0ABY4JMR8_9BACI|nr:DUF805 domain-containing protein [Gottfriedia acidiceleris]UPM54726.1 DUF805 domain-containing protein [Gottfriedia acidiceleris]
MEWYLKVLKNYAVFNGRARRTEYWMFFLFNAIITIILSILQSIADIDNILTGIYGLLTILPSLAVGARRLHDSGRSGWWLLIGIIPFIGTIILIIFFCLDSEVGDNRFGANPKY